MEPHAVQKKDRTLGHVAKPAGLEAENKSVCSLGADRALSYNVFGGERCKWF